MTKIKIIAVLMILMSFGSCKTNKIAPENNSSNGEISLIINKTPYNPKPGMQRLRAQNEIIGANGEVKLKQPMHFLVFGDSKGSKYLPAVLKIADSLKPQFCLTTSDLVKKGAGEMGENYYKKLDHDAGWFFRKYPTWPTLGNHEVSGPKTSSGKENYNSGVRNFVDFFGLKDPLYSFSYGNTKFIALDWIKVSESSERMKWLENELKEAKGKHIFVFKHRPYYTVGRKSYKDVEGRSTPVTQLFTKYHVDAVFSGHDHIYYRTLRNGVNYIVSAGAGATIYNLKRESDAVEGDAYYGRTKNMDSENFKFHAASGKEVFFDQPMFYVVSVKVDQGKVTFEMIDTKGNVWDKFVFNSKYQSKP